MFWRDDDSDSDGSITIMQFFAHSLQFNCCFYCTKFLIYDNIKDIVKETCMLIYVIS